MPHLEITEVVLLYFNIANNNSHQNSTVLYTFVSNKSLDQLSIISPKKFKFLKTFESNFHKLKYGLLIKVLNRWR